MQNPILIHHHHSLIAHAKIGNLPNSKAMQRQYQRWAVRQLLHYALHQHPSDYAALSLKDNCHPYTLIDNTGTVHFFVSFSHSNDTVALIVSPTPCGIDIETSPISSFVAKRFFHCNEQAAINHLPSTAQAVARLRLWQIKESYAKAKASTLSQTLSYDFSNILPAILHHQPISPHNPHTIHQIYQGEHWLALTLQSN